MASGLNLYQDPLFWLGNSSTVGVGVDDDDEDDDSSAARAELISSRRGSILIFMYGLGLATIGFVASLAV